jgi:hypothetical protein
MKWTVAVGAWLVLVVAVMIGVDSGKCQRRRRVRRSRRVDRAQFRTEWR